MVLLALVAWLVLDRRTTFGQTPSSRTLLPGETTSFSVRTCGGMVPRCLVLGFSVASEATQPVVASFEPSTITLTLTAPAGVVVQILSGCVDNDGPAPEVHCSVSGLSSPPTVTVTFTTVAAGADRTISYAPGWNLVAGPEGTVVQGVGGVLYTLQAGDMDYETIPLNTPLQAGQGYWAYFPAVTTQNLASGGADRITLELPANQYVMVGNPSLRAATITGADVVWEFDPRLGNYVYVSMYASSTRVAAGQGAWVLVTERRLITITAR